MKTLFRTLQSRTARPIQFVALYASGMIMGWGVVGYFHPPREVVDRVRSKLVDEVDEVESIIRFADPIAIERPPVIVESEWNTESIVEPLMHFENDPLRIGQYTDKLRTDKYTNKSEIGYGFTSDGCADAIREGKLKPGYVLPKSMTSDQSKQFLIDVMIPTYAKIVDRVVTVELTNNQRNALIMFTYNLGEGSLKMLVAQPGRLNDGNYDVVTRKIVLYTGSGKHKNITGLVRRRKIELDMWQA